ARQGFGTGPFDRHRACRLRHALPVQAVQSGIPALQAPAGPGVAGAPHEYPRAVAMMGSSMATDCLFREDAYLDHCTARVVEIAERGIVLDRTVFYATSGG